MSIPEKEIEELKNMVVEIFTNINFPVDSFDTLGILQSSDFYIGVFGSIFDVEVFDASEVTVVIKRLDESAKIQFLIDFLSESILGIDLDHISGFEILNGNIVHIKNFLQLIIAIINSGDEGNGESSRLSSPLKSKLSTNPKNRSFSELGEQTPSMKRLEAFPLTNQNLVKEGKGECLEDKDSVNKDSRSQAISENSQSQRQQAARNPSLDQGPKIINKKRVIKEKPESIVPHSKLKSDKKKRVDVKKTKKVKSKSRPQTMISAPKRVVKEISMTDYEDILHRNSVRVNNCLQDFNFTHVFPCSKNRIRTKTLVSQSLKQSSKMTDLKFQKMQRTIAEEKARYSEKLREQTTRIVQEQLTNKTDTSLQGQEGATAIDGRNGEGAAYGGQAPEQGHSRKHRVLLQHSDPTSA